MFCKAHDIGLYVIHVVEGGVEIFVVVVRVNTIQVCEIYSDGLFVLRACCISYKVIVAFVCCAHS